MPRVYLPETSQSSRSSYSQDFEPRYNDNYSESTEEGHQRKQISANNLEIESISTLEECIIVKHDILSAGEVLNILRQVPLDESRVEYDDHEDVRFAVTVSEECASLIANEIDVHESDIQTYIPARICKNSVPLQKHRVFGTNEIMRGYVCILNVIGTGVMRFVDDFDDSTFEVKVGAGTLISYPNERCQYEFMQDPDVDVQIILGPFGQYSGSSEYTGDFSQRVVCQPDGSSLERGDGANWWGYQDEDLDQTLIQEKKIHGEDADEYRICCTCTFM